MSASITVGSSPLLTLPLEIREEIYSNLLLPQHVYTSSSNPDTYSLHRSNRAPATYVDTRIYLPSRLPTSILQTNKQLREECMTFHTRLLGSRLPATLVDNRPPEETSSYQVASRNNTTDDERMERAHDEDMARITLEVCRGYRGTMGFYMPERRDPSPRFLGLVPLLGRLKMIKFTVWAGFDWWSDKGPWRGPGAIRTITARLRRTWPDQDDTILEPSRVEYDPNIVSLPQPEDKLFVAIGVLLQHLPLVEEVRIDVLMHLMDFVMWDFSDTQWKGIQGWLDGPVCRPDKGQLKKVSRRLMLVNPTPPIPSACMLRQVETRGEGEDFFVVRRGTNNLDPAWTTEVIPDPPLTETFQRVAGESRHRASPSANTTPPQKETEV